MRRLVRTAFVAPGCKAPQPMRTCLFCRHCRPRFPSFAIVVYEELAGGAGRKREWSGDSRESSFTPLCGESGINACGVAALAISLRRLQSDGLGLERQAFLLCLGETQALLSELFPEHPVFFQQVIDELLLLSIHPACYTDQDQLPGLHEGNAARFFAGIQCRLPIRSPS